MTVTLKFLWILMGVVGNGLGGVVTLITLLVAWQDQKKRVFTSLCPANKH